MRNASRYKWFSAAEVGETKVFPNVVPTIDGGHRRIERNAITAVRAYYQRKHPGRKWSVRTVPEGYVVQRLPDNTPLSRGRPTRNDEQTRTGLNNKAARQAAYRQRQAALFSYAMTNAANADPDPRVRELRQRALFQLQNTTAIVLEAWEAVNRPNPWAFHVKPELIGEMHPNRQRAMVALAQALTKDTGVEFSYMSVQVSVAGTPRFALYLTVGDPPSFGTDTPEVQESALPWHILRDSSLIDA